MSSSLVHEPKHDRLTALDTLGVATNALLHAQDAAARRSARMPQLVLVGLPAIMAAYLAFCHDEPERQLPSGWLLSDKLLTTKTARVSFWTAKGDDTNILFGDLAAGAYNYAFRRYQLEIPPSHVDDDVAMCVLELEPSPSVDLAHLSQPHTFAPSQLCAEGHPAHILHLSTDLERLMRQAAVRNIVYLAEHPTVLVFHALQHIMFASDLSATKVSDSLFSSSFLVRVICSFERESAERGVKGHFLSPEAWYACLDVHRADLDTLREKVDKIAWFALGRKLAVADSRLDRWSSTGSDRAFQEGAAQYTYAMQMLAELLKVTVDFFRSSDVGLPLSDIHRFPFLDQCARPRSPELVAPPGPLKRSPLRHRRPPPTTTSPDRAGHGSATVYHPLPREEERVWPHRSTTLPAPAEERPAAVAASTSSPTASVPAWQRPFRLRRKATN